MIAVRLARALSITTGQANGLVWREALIIHMTLYAFCLDPKPNKHLNDMRSYEAEYQTHLIHSEQHRDRSRAAICLNCHFNHKLPFPPIVKTK